jgi:hypothetical protein
MKYTIYIPSKGRHDTCLTAEHLLKDNMDFRVVVEPQDAKLYIEKYGDDKVLVMTENNKGMAYVRNWIKQYSISRRESYHWQLDDNIKNFKRRVDGKNIKCSPSPLFDEIEEEVDKYTNIGIAGMRYDLFAFSYKKYYSNNVQISSCFLFNNALDIWWRPALVEDTDYALQVLELKYCTLMFNTLLIEKAKTMSLKGGCTDSEYVGDGRANNMRGLQAQWPGVFELVNKYGRTTIKPSRVWGKYKQELKLKNLDSILEQL